MKVKPPDPLFGARIFHAKRFQLWLDDPKRGGKNILYRALESYNTPSRILITPESDPVLTFASAPTVFKAVEHLTRRLRLAPTYMSNQYVWVDRKALRDVLMNLTVNLP